MKQISSNDNQIAINVVSVSKQYRLGAITGRTLQGELQSWWAKKRGKEDPNLRIGVDTSLFGKKFMALDGVDLTVYKGERLGIIGANGAGKSTLLKLLCRVTAPTSGEIDLYGRVSSMLEVGTGFHGEMTGRENIYMNGAILGMKQSEIDEKIEDIIDFAEVREFIDTPVKRYSSGMFVKLAFSVAAHLNSNIMIMDEVLAVGDMAFQKKCLDKMRQNADEEGKTILYVSHNMNTIRRLCDRCIVMDHGKKIFDGDVEEAIAIYMNQSLSENQVDMDLTQISHTKILRDTGLKMTHLTLTDKVTPVYESGEDLKMELTVHTTKELKGLSLRLTLRTDGDEGLGTGWKEIDNLPADQDTVIPITFPLDMFEKGTFYGSIGICYTDELGHKIPLDHITRAFKIEIPGNPSWSYTAFGPIRFTL